MICLLFSCHYQTVCPFYPLFCLRSSIGIHKPGCVNITTFQCELSNFGISSYGTYSGKVRALLGEEASAWVESKTITLDIESKSLTHIPQKFT